MDKSQSRVARRSLYDAFLSTQPTRVVVVDENSASRVPLAAALRAEGYEVVEVVDPDELDDCLGRPLASCNPFELPALIIASMQIAGGGGLDLVARLRADNNPTPVILVSSEPDEWEHSQAHQLGAAYVLDKARGIDDVRVAALNLVQPY